jgi:hypothetical protein
MVEYVVFFGYQGKNGRFCDPDRFDGYLDSLEDEGVIGRHCFPHMLIGNRYLLERHRQSLEKYGFAPFPEEIEEFLASKIPAPMTEQDVRERRLDCKTRMPDHFLNAGIAVVKDKDRIIKISQRLYTRYGLEITFFEQDE